MELQEVTPTVLLFQVRDPMRSAKIHRYLRSQSIRLIEVQNNDLHQSIGADLGLPGIERNPSVYKGPEFEEEMLVMFGFQGSMMRNFLQFFRDEGLAPIALKAVATPTNIFWTGLELYDALKKERAYFQSREHRQ